MFIHFVALGMAAIKAIAKAALLNLWRMQRNSSCGVAEKHAQSFTRADDHVEVRRLQFVPNAPNGRKEGRMMIFLSLV